MRRLQVAASKLGARLFRQNTGMAWVGKMTRGPGTVRLGPHDVVIRNARPFHAGVPGMSDLGGWMPVEITAEMIGQTIAVAAQVEVKDRGSPTPEQRNWIDAVNAAGGKAGVVHNETELSRLLIGN
jgi:hypothetical protein